MVRALFETRVIKAKAAVATPDGTQVDIRPPVNEQRDLIANREEMTARPDEQPVGKSGTRQTDEGAAVLVIRRHDVYRRSIRIWSKWTFTWYSGNHCSIEANSADLDGI